MSLEYDDILSNLSIAEERAQASKTRFINTLLKRGIISPPYSRLLSEIHTNTAFNDAVFSLRKIGIAMETRRLFKRGQPSPAAYIGSGIDWHFPVALGLRKIDMIDPLFENQSSEDTLTESISKFDSHFRVRHGKTTQIEFNVGIEDKNDRVVLSLYPGTTEIYRADGLQTVIEFFGPTAHEAGFVVNEHIAGLLTNGSLIGNFDYVRLLDNDPHVSGVG